MAYYIVGLDIGSRTVRAVLFERTFRGYSVAEVRKAAILQDELGEGPAEGAVEKAVEDVLFGLKAGQVTVVCSYPTEKASVWFLELPFTDPKRIAQTVTFEVEDMVPFDLDDMLFTYRLMGNEGNQSKLMAALAPRKQIGRQLKSLENFGVNPISLLLDGHAIANALPTKSHDSVALIDVGHRRALVTVIRNGAVEHIQSVPGGGQVITQALMDKWNLPFDVAEFLKHHRQLPPGFEMEMPEGVDNPTDDVGDIAFNAERVPDEPIPAAEASGDYAPDMDDESAITTLSWRRLPVETTQLTDVDEEHTPLPFIDEDEKTPTGRIRPYRVVAEIEEEGDVAPDEEPGLQLSVGAEAPAVEYLTAERVDGVIRTAILEMVRPIRASLIAYEANNKSEISAVALAGGSSALGELPAAIDAEIGLPAHPIHRLGADHSELPGGEPPAEFALAFALGLRGVTDGKLKETDFRKEEFASSGDISRFRVLMVGVAAAVILLFVSGAAYGGWQYQQLNGELNAVNDKMAKLVVESLPPGTTTEDSIRKAPESGLVYLMERAMAYEERAKVLNVADDRVPTAIEVLREVSDHLSPGEPGDESFVKVDIDEYQAMENTVKLKGYTDSFEATGKIEAALKKSPVFEDVTQGDGGRSRGRDTRRNFTFTLTLKDGAGS